MKHLKNRQIPYQNVRGPLLTVCLMFFVVSSFKLLHDETIKVACEIERPSTLFYCFFSKSCVCFGITIITLENHCNQTALSSQAGCSQLGHNIVNLAV